ncbi:hypothetical protein SFRURICE_004563 [Spodoptera frugiperda]|nr:hypothetical protein SFRURICE_004563 [Spodoptera frugiperda]
MLRLTLIYTARLVRWLGNWLSCDVDRVRFLHGAITRGMIHKLLFSLGGCHVHMNWGWND